MSKRYWLSIITTLIFTCISIVLYTYFSKSIPDQLTDQLKVTGKLAARDFELSVSKNLLFLENLAQQIARDSMYKEHWDTYSQNTLERNKNIVFIAFIDEMNTIEAINPANILDKNGEHIRKTIKDHFYSAFSQAAHAEWLMHTDDSHILMVNLPLKAYNAPGMLLAALDMDSELRVINNFLSDYAFQLKNEAGDIVYSHNDPKINDFDASIIFDHFLTIKNGSMQKWSIQLLYNDTDIYDHSFVVLNWMLVFGILVSLLMGCLLFFYLKSLDAVKNAEIGNQQLVRANMELEDQRKKAQKASQAKTEFLSNMSHEIRTPLNAILGLCELLNANKSSVDNENYIHMMQESSKTLLGLVNDVLAIDRIESGNETLAQDRFEPCAIVENLISFYSPQMQNKNLELTSCSSSCPKNIVLGDRTKFEQISLNIVSNAVKFTKRGSISITCEERVVKGSRVAISLSVKDTGIGIPAEKKEAIFDRFTQLDVGVRKKHSGGGLGLYITRQLVHLMHGSISVTSKEGEGSTFVVNLELPLAESRKKIIGENFVREMGRMHLNVLAVDDNKLNVIILTKLLKNMGMNPDIAYDGRQALEKAESKNYDIIFMDVHMPEMDGYEATRRIRHKNHEVLILGLSADATTSSIEEGLCSGMNNYLTKPLDSEKLALILTKHFKGQPY